MNQAESSLKLALAHNIITERNQLRNLGQQFFTNPQEPLAIFEHWDKTNRGLYTQLAELGCPIYDRRITLERHTLVLERGDFYAAIDSVIASLELDQHYRVYQSNVAYVDSLRLPDTTVRQALLDRGFKDSDFSITILETPLLSDFATADEAERFLQHSTQQAAKPVLEAVV